MPSVIIPYRNEALLPDTIKGIRKTADVEMIAVNDGGKKIDTADADKVIDMESPRGLCYCRHKGIEQAENDEVIVLDAHMFFLDNGWADRLAKTVKKDRTRLVNAMSVRCNEEKHDPVWHLSRGRVEVGARFIEHQTRSCGRREILARKWLGRRAFGLYDIPCLLGGAYAMSRDYYLNELKGIWQYHRGWGFSEQLISIAQHYKGNKIVTCGDAPVGHLYRTGKQSTVPYSMELWKVMHNQLLLLYLFASEDYLEQNLSWLGAGRQREVRHASDHLKDIDWQSLRDWFGPENWPEFYKRNVGEGK